MVDPSTNKDQYTVVEDLDFAWRVHSAQEAWTAKVDVKASILLALVGGALFAVAAGHGKDGLFSALTDFWQNVEIGGVFLLLCSLLLAAAAVFPMLGRAADHREIRVDHVVYFGHLRHWQPTELANFLSTLTAPEQRQMLAEQLIAMATRNWWKHRFLQGALLLGLTGLALIGAAALST